MIVSSKESPVKASVVQFDNAKVQFAFDGVDRKADEVNLASGETDGDDDVRTLFLCRRMLDRNCMI